MAGGRPLLFETAEELQKTIDAYFESCKVQYDPATDEFTSGDIMTITGLALYLGFESRQSFYDYEERSEFSYAIKRARLRIESNYEKALFSKNAAGPIFALKNFGWTDKQEIDQKTEHSGSIAVTWQEPPVSDSDNKGSDGVIQGI